MRNNLWILGFLAVTATSFAEEAPSNAPSPTPSSPPTYVNQASPYYLPPLPAPSHVRPGVSEGMQSQMPLSPEEVEWVRRTMEASQYAMHKGQSITMHSRVVEVSVDPGSKPSTIKVLPGFVTSLSIVGKDGTPWPIVTYTVGSPNQFTVDVPALAGNIQSQAKDALPSNGAPSNLLTIQPRFFGAKTNLLLTLKGLDVPVTLFLDAGAPDAKSADGRVTARINRRAPDAPPPLVIPPPPSPLDTNLLQFLEQTPPKDAVELKVSIEGVRAWRWKGSVIVRSPFAMIIPAWTAEVRQDGISVYQLPQTPNITVRTPSGVLSSPLEG